MISIALVCVFVLVFVLVAWLSRRHFAVVRTRRDRGQAAVTELVKRCLGCTSVEQVMAASASVFESIFDVDGVLLLDQGDDGRWRVRAGITDVGVPVAPQLQHLFAWFKSNPMALVRDELRSRRLGAMRPLLRQMFEQTRCDVLVPLATQERTFSLLAFKAARRLQPFERGLLRLLREDLTLVTLNVTNYDRAAEVVKLAHEVDLARRVEAAQIPKERSGRQGRITWAADYHPAERANSDFFGVYPLAQERVMIVIGDTVGVGLAGSMVSAVLKACCATVFAHAPSEFNPGELLQFLNVSLYRANCPAVSACFVALVDARESKVHFANAGHTRPFHAVAQPNGDDGLAVTTLHVTGPLLGDANEQAFAVRSRPLSPGDALLFFSNGVVAARNSQGSELKDSGLRKIFAEVSAASPEEACRTLSAKVARHRDGQAPVDDELLLVVGISHPD